MVVSWRPPRTAWWPALRLTVPVVAPSTGSKVTTPPLGVRGGTGFVYGTTISPSTYKRGDVNP